MANEFLKIYSAIARLLNITRAKACHAVNSVIVKPWKMSWHIIEENRLQM